MSAYGYQQQGQQHPQSLLAQQQAARYRQAGPGGTPQQGYGANPQQQAMLARQQAAMAAGAQGPPQQPNTELVGDGNDALRSAKRRKPTDRSLPIFAVPPSSAASGPTTRALEESTNSLASLAQSYKKLQDVERKLDWTVSRKKVELADGGISSRMAGVTRTLRLHFETTVHDQPWQVAGKEGGAPVEVLPLPASADAPAPAAAPTTEGSTEEKKDGDGDIEVGAVDGGEEKKDEAATGETEKQEVPAPAAAPAPAPAPGTIPPTSDISSSADFKNGTGIPGFALKISAEVLGLSAEESQGKGLSNWVKRIVIETDRDPTTYDKTGPFDWRRTDTPTGAITLALPSSTPTKLRVSLFLDHTPELFSLIPELAALLEMRMGDRVSVLQALWSYVRGKGLLDEERKMVKTDDRMKKIFSGQEKIPFHHLPEYVNRFMSPLQAITFDYVVRTDVEATHVAFDVDLSVEDPTRREMERVMLNLNAPNERLSKEISGIDEKIAADATLSKSTLQKRTFLTAFATSPVPFIDSFLASQASDLDLILSSDRAAQAAVGGGATWREEMRNSDVWKGGWVEEGASVFGARVGEGKMREEIMRSQQQAQQAAQQQQQHAQPGMGQPGMVPQGYPGQMQYPGRR
ncbi:hypothetical protein MNV49_006246 [Pseudohyphozyma bogoriensis]|nr:hypothetical protein MNV49_006246 [Pseudohyphozyma bogoriensis]